ncbi:hypothetical protein C1708_22880 [Streptomyces sp. DH-12]|uniref:hypothetical protein n=1 Tax=Streptomyces sp. DH-12 TaxID=2072509 RepID=UPI000CCDC76F|nr:hypothetical protein [Streptomyces sp. DH-12]PNV34802.1 hypothetical protein C1708_22880 [Streptomyces sp. DH-12]
MPDAPRHTQDTWIPRGPGAAPDAPATGPASADPGHEAATPDRKTDAARTGDTSPSRGGADSTAGLGGTDAPHGTDTFPGGTDTAHRPGGTETGSAGSRSPLVAAHPQTGAGTHGTAPGTTGRTAVPGPDGTGAHTPGAGPDGTGDHGSAPGAKGGAGHTGHHGPDARLLPDDTCDRLSARLRQAVAGFVDRPRDAVEEADLVLHELTERLTDALTERRRALAQNWRTPAQGDPKDGSAPAADTEQLRLALRDYRELAERLLAV